MSQTNGKTPAFQIDARPARLADVPQMMPLLNEYVRQAEILPRREAEVYQSIRDWVVVETAGKVLGMGALVILWHDLAEIRSLVIDPTYQGQGLGRAIIDRLLAEAKMLELPRVFALTRKPGFFLKLGFLLTRMEDLPRKVQKDCVFCPKFKACDEVAVIRPLPQLFKVDPVTHSKLNQNGHQPRAAIPQKPQKRF
jgi:amino-acid N-acetyltransferase